MLYGRGGKPFFLRQEDREISEETPLSWLVFSNKLTFGEEGNFISKLSIAIY